MTKELKVEIAAEEYVKNWAKPNVNTFEENWALGGAFLAGWEARDKLAKEDSLLLDNIIEEMTPEEIESLREKAKAATPGPWVRDEFNSPITQVIAVENEVVVYHHQHPRQCDIRVVPNFKFIEAASPDVILKLLDERDELLARIESMKLIVVAAGGLIE